MSVTEATGQTNPSWWSQQCPRGEADPCDPGTGGTNDSMGFGDFLDMINPLQHIPVVSTLYRELTGDTISEPARMAGGALWGGPAGVIGALANSITAGETGGDIGATAMAMLRGEPTSSGAPAPAAMVADASLSDSADMMGALPAGVAQFAAAGQTATPALGTSPDTGAVPGSTQTSAAIGSQEFSGSSASRLDAFIQRANAVRAPGPAAARGPAGDGLNIQVAPSAASLKAAPARNAGAHAPQAPQTIARTVPAEAPAPLKLASDGNTDVAQWMMRALDRYESMKGQEQS